MLSRLFSLPVRLINCARFGADMHAQKLVFVECIPKSNLGRVDQFYLEDIMGQSWFGVAAAV
jgi:hypothetical protein